MEFPQARFYVYGAFISFFILHFHFLFSFFVHAFQLGIRNDYRILLVQFEFDVGKISLHFSATKSTSYYVLKRN